MLLSIAFLQHLSYQKSFIFSPYFPCILNSTKETHIVSVLVVHIGVEFLGVGRKLLTIELNILLFSKMYRVWNLVVYPFNPFFSFHVEITQNRFFNHLFKHLSTSSNFFSTRFFLFLKLWCFQLALSLVFEKAI